MSFAFHMKWHHSMTRRLDGLSNAPARSQSAQVRNFFPDSQTYIFKAIVLKRNGGLEGWTRGERKSLRLSVDVQITRVFFLLLAMSFRWMGTWVGANFAHGNNNNDNNLEVLYSARIYQTRHSRRWVYTNFQKNRLLQWWILRPKCS